MEPTIASVHRWYNEMVQDYSLGSYEFADIITGDLHCAMGVPTVDKDTVSFKQGKIEVHITFYGRTQHCETVRFKFYKEAERLDSDVVTRFYDKDSNITTCSFG